MKKQNKTKNKTKTNKTKNKQTNKQTKTRTREGSRKVYFPILLHINDLIQLWSLVKAWSSLTSTHLRQEIIDT